MLYLVILIGVCYRIFKLFKIFWNKRCRKMKVEIFLFQLVVFLNFIKFIVSFDVCVKDMYVVICDFDFVLLFIDFSSFSLDELEESDFL